MPVLDRPTQSAPVAPGERAARRSLREQVARLEGELVRLAGGEYQPLPVPAPAAGVPAGPRLLTLGELEAVRDDLAARAAGLRAARARLADEHAASRALIERMLADPAAHKWVRVANHDIGEPGCKHWHVRPRLGLIGMLAGWWHVKVSSGCPLPRPGGGDRGA